MIAGAKPKSFRPFQHDPFAFPVPASDLSERSKHLLISLYALRRTLPRTQHLGQTFRQWPGFDLDNCFEIPTRRHSPPQVDAGIAILSTVRSAFAPGRIGAASTKALIKWERPAGAGPSQKAARRQWRRARNQSFCLEIAELECQHRSSRPGTDERTDWKTFQQRVQRRAVRVHNEQTPSPSPNPGAALG